MLKNSICVKSGTIPYDFIGTLPRSQGLASERPGTLTREMWEQIDLFSLYVTTIQYNTGHVIIP